MWDSIDGQRVNFIKEAWFANPEYRKQLDLGIDPAKMRDDQGRPVDQYFHYIIWNVGTGFAMSPLGGFMEPQVVEITALMGEGAFPFSCEIERVPAESKGMSEGYRISEGSIGAPELDAGLAGILLGAPHGESEQSLEEYAAAVTADA